MTTGKNKDVNYIILDLEWNQCPYGKKKEDPKLPFEIIEIGAVKLDSSFQEVGTFHETIRPVLYRKLLVRPLPRLLHLGSRRPHRAAEKCPLAH